MRMQRKENSATGKNQFAFSFVKHSQELIYDVESDGILYSLFPVIVDNFNAYLILFRPFFR
jgi:hypothetical protein